jgi:MSHA pilin protein MshD
MKGMTLVELVMFIVIVGVGLAGVISAFNVTVMHSADPMVRKQVLAVAEATLEEVLLKDYADPSGACTPSTTPSCRVNTPADRQNYNDVSDYAGYDQTGITEIDGTTAVAGLANYRLTIAVDATASLGTLAAPNVKRVTVTVAGGGETISLVGYRTDYDDYSK